MHAEELTCVEMHAEELMCACEKELTCACEMKELTGACEMMLLNGVPEGKEHDDADESNLKAHDDADECNLKADECKPKGLVADRRSYDSSEAAVMPGG